MRFRPVRVFAALSDFAKGMPTDEGQAYEVDCMDCGRPYPHGLDTVLTKKQWLMVHPDDGGVLCPSCIVNRAEKLPEVIALYACIVFGKHSDPGDTLEHMITAMRLENADYCRVTAETKYELAQAVAENESLKAYRNKMLGLIREYRNACLPQDMTNWNEPCATCKAADSLISEVR